MAKTPQTVKLAAAITPQMSDELDFVIDALGTSRSDVVRDSVQAWMLPRLTAMGEGYCEAASVAHGLLLEAKTANEVDRVITKHLAEWRALAAQTGRPELLTPLAEDGIRLMAACAKSSLEQGYDGPLYAISMLVGAGR